MAMNYSMRTRAGVGRLGEELLDGYCYLAVVKLSRRAELKRGLGSWPTVRQLLLGPLDAYRCNSRASCVDVVDTYDGRVHFRECAGVAEVRVPVYKWLAAAALLERWPPGTLGAALRFFSPPVVEVGLLECRIGGSCEPIRPLVMSEQAVNLYNAAIVSAGYMHGFGPGFVSMIEGAGVLVDRGSLKVGCSGVGSFGICGGQCALDGKTVGVEGSSAAEVCMEAEGPELVAAVGAEAASGVQGVGDGVATGEEREVPSVGNVGESKYDRNRRWAAERKDRKIKKKKNSQLLGGLVPEWRRKGLARGEGLKIGQVVAGCVAAEDVDGELKDSVKRKWKVKNELEIARAQRDLEVLKASSVDDEVRNRQVSTRASIERNMVSIEKTHAQLRRADCVVRSDDDAVTGTVKTLVSGVSSGTISPNSSVSEAEVRKLQKDFVDGQAENEKLRAALSRVGLDLAMVDAMDKKEWTVDLTGHVSEEVEDVFDRLYPRGTAYPDDPHMCDDGKLRRTIIGF